ncbi:MAG: AAA family ATPase [Candidatus Ozemobacteraceae bacterium]
MMISKTIASKPKLPIGIQSFEKMRYDGFVYVDKTSFIARMASGDGNPEALHCISKRI